MIWFNKIKLMKFKIDNLQYCNWTREVFEINRQAELDAVHVTIVYHEDYNELLDEIKKWQKLFDENSDLNLKDFRAKIINSYENLLIKQYNKKVIILRLAGLYSNTSKNIAPNRIHRDSAVKIINFFFQNDFDKFENCFFN